MDAGQITETRGGIAIRDPEASHDEASPKESLQKHETLRRPAHQANRRGLDHRFLRSQPRVIGPGSLRKADPGGATTTLTRNQRV